MSLNHFEPKEYEFNAGRYFQEGWRTFGNNAGPLIGMNLFFLIIIIFMSQIPILSNLGNLISGALYAGIYVYIANKYRGTADGKDFFGGFKYFGSIFAYSLATLLFIVPAFLLVFLAGFPILDFLQVAGGGLDPYDFSIILQNRIAESGLLLYVALLIAFVIMLYVSVSYLFTVPLIVVTELGFWEAMELSRKTVAKYFFGFLFGYIALTIMLILGIIVTCGVGLLILLPLFQMIVFEAFRLIFDPFEHKSMNIVDEFGSSAGDVNSEAEED